MTERYFVDASLDDSRIVLSGPEAHHLAHVMRKGVGDEVTLFDGSGIEAQAQVQRVGRAEIELVVLARFEVDRELSRRVTLGVALPKGDRQRWLVEKAVELGVTRLVPLVTARSTDRHSASHVERLGRAAIEAAKQCGRNRLMELETPREVTEFLGSAAEGSLRFIAHPDPSPPTRLPPGERGEWLASVKQAGPESEIWLAVGPEGGFTPAEIETAAAHGWRTIGLGARILRVETAALALAAAVTLAAE